MGDALLLKFPDVAKRLGVSEYQARAEHERGILKGRRVGRFIRFTEADLDAYLERIREGQDQDATGLTPGSRNRRRQERAS